jgi:hypothetical protein
MNNIKIRPFIIARRLAFLFSIIALLIFSCRRDNEKAGWETGIVAPLLKSSLSIKDILSDTLIQTGTDNQLKVVYENHLYKMSLDSLFDLPDTSVTKIYNLDSISLLNQTISYPVTLGQIDPQLGILNGLTLPIPAIPNQSSAPFIINADTLFQTMTLITGFIDVSVHNGFPIDITNVAIDLVNTSNGASIVHASFPLIASNSTATNTYSLAGKTVEGNMTGTIDSISSPGSVGSVLIDTSDALVATLSIHDLHPSTATAIFPAQNLIDKSQPFIVKLDTVQLKEAKLKSGNVVMDLYSTLQDSVHFTYKLQSATLNGDTFTVSYTLPPAPAGGPPSEFHHTYDFSGYHLDMANLPQQDTVNKMYNSFIARVDSTGQMKTLSLSDSMYAHIGFVDLIPSYGRGYLGQQLFNIGPAELPIDIFEHLNGTVQLEDVKLSIVAENGIGVNARVDINSITSTHNNPLKTVTLTGTAVNNPIFVGRATDNGGMPPVHDSITSLLLDKSNSNAPAFISNLPDKLNYSMSLQTNPNGNVSNWNDFIYSDHLMEFNIDMEMPLSYIANDLNFTLTDTAVFTLSPQDVSRIKDGTLTLLVDNGFPFSVDITLQMLDLNGAIINTLVQNAHIDPATVASNGKVSEKKRSKVSMAVDQALINKFFDTSKMKISAKYSTTTPPTVYYKIYSDYTIDFQLTGDFTYEAH